MNILFFIENPFDFRHFISDKKSRIIVTTNAGSSNEVGVQLYSGACRGSVFGGGITLDLTAPGVTPDLTAPPKILTAPTYHHIPIYIYHTL